MDNMDKQGILIMPTLGRPFQLGMLYDVRSDKILPGVTLWDPDDLQKVTLVRAVSLLAKQSSAKHCIISTQCGTQFIYLNF